MTVATSALPIIGWLTSDRNAKRFRGVTSRARGGCSHLAAGLEEVSAAPLPRGIAKLSEAAAVAYAAAVVDVAASPK